MFAYWKKMDEINKTNRVLVVVVAALLLTNITLALSLARSPKTLRFFISPSLAYQGGEISAEKIPETSVYSFVATLLPKLNTWSGEDIDERKKSIYTFKPYLSPKHFQHALEINKMQAEYGLLKNEQIASLYEGLNVDDVHEIAPNQWTVKLKLRLTQRLNDKNRMVISDKVIAYTVKVIRVGYSKDDNPYELVIDGYAEPEKLEKDLLDEVTRA